MSFASVGYFELVSELLLELNQIKPGHLEMVVDYVELVGVGDGGAAVEEGEPGLVEDAEDGGVAGVEHRVGDELVHGAQGEQGPLEVAVLLGDLELLYITKDLEGEEDR